MTPSPPLPPLLLLLHPGQTLPPHQLLAHARVQTQPHAVGPHHPPTRPTDLQARLLLQAHKGGGSDDPGTRTAFTGTTVGDQHSSPAGDECEGQAERGKRAQGEYDTAQKEAWGGFRI